MLYLAYGSNVNLDHLHDFLDAHDVQLDTELQSEHAILPCYPPRPSGVVTLQPRAMNQVGSAGFINGIPIRDRDGQSDDVGPSDEIFVMQALSGG